MWVANAFGVHANPRDSANPMQPTGNKVGGVEVALHEETIVGAAMAPSVRVPDFLMSWHTYKLAREEL